MGTGADNGHVAFQNVDELGKLVKGCSPQESPHACYPAVPGYRLKRVRLVVHYHGTELQASEGFVIQPAASLAEQHRTPGCHLDSRAYYDIQERE